MPRYSITDSTTGRTLVIEGDSAPTETEAEQLFASTPPREPSKPLTMERVGEVAGDIGTEAAGAIAGQMIGVVGGPVGIMVGGAVGGGIGNAGAQLRRMSRGEQEDFRFGELIAAAGINAIPGAAIAKGATVFARTGRAAATLGGAAAVGSVVQQKIDNPADKAVDFTDALAAGALGAAGGGVIQGGIEAVKAVTPRAAAALRSLFGKTDPKVLENKPLSEAIVDIAKAEGIPPSQVQARIEEQLRMGMAAKDAQSSAALLSSIEGPAPITGAPAPRAPEYIPLPPEQPLALPAVVDPAAPGAGLVDTPSPTALPSTAATLALPEPVPAASRPAPASRMSATPNGGATDATPSVGGAGEPAIVDIAGKGKGPRLKFGAREDGETDIIDAIQEMRGAPPPGPADKGGEYDGFAETFRGQARILRSASRTGNLDRWLGDLADTFPQFERLRTNPDAFYAEVTKSLEDRARLKTAAAIEKQTGKFRAAALENKGRATYETPAVKTPGTTDDLVTGDEFRVKREKFTVTGVEEDGSVIVQDGPRYGTQILPPGAPLYHDRGTMRRAPRTDPLSDWPTPEPAPTQDAPGPKTPDAGGQAPAPGAGLFDGGPTGGDTTFNLAGETGPDFTGAMDRAAEAAAARAAQQRAQRTFFDNPERGAINPAVMRGLTFAAARGASGAVAGSLVGETPEERAGHMLAGGLLGLSASPALAAKLGRMAIAAAKVPATRTAVGRRVLPEATLPFELREQLILKPGAVAATGQRGNTAQRALEKALLAEKDPEQAAYEVWSHLTGQRATVRPSLVAVATEARAAIDELSDKLVTMGVATGDLANTLNANKRRYLRRAFRIFQRDDWRPEPDVIDDWQRQYLASNPKATPQDAQDLALALLDRANAEQFISTGSLLRQNRDAFRPRKNLDAATLRLLGEIQEPVELLGQTIPRMARLIETHETQKNLVQLGRRLGVFSVRSDPNLGHVVQLAKDQTYKNGHVVYRDADSAGPLAGIWTSSEMREALEAASANQSDQSALWRALAGATAYSKFTKTVLNPASWVPNAVGAAFDAVKNGNVRILASGSAWADAFAVAREEIGLDPLGAPGRAQVVALFNRMQRLGLAGQGSSADFQRGLETAFGEAAKRGATRAMSTLGRAYAGSEEVMRFLNWQSEIARYRAAFPQMRKQELEEYAARIVRATTTNYAMIPDAVRKLSVGGVLGTFVNFPYEQFRHAYNIARIAREDIAKGTATGNRALAQAGAARLGALLTLAAGTGAYAAWTKREVGFDDEQDAAFRRRLPPWDRNQVLSYVDRDADRVGYMAQSYVNPQAILVSGLLAAERGDSLEEGAMNFLKATGETFGGGSVLLKPGMEALLNRTERGRQIASPEDAAGKQINDRASYFLDRAYTPGFVNELARAAKAMRGEIGPDGQVYTLSDSLQRLAGRRVQRVDLPFRFSREAYDFNRRLADVASGYASATRQANEQPDRIDTAYQLAETRRQVIHKDLAQYLDDAKTLGYDEERAIKWLRDGGVPAEMILGALDRRYIPAEREKPRTNRQIMEEIQAKPQRERLSSMVDEVTRNPAFLQTIQRTAKDAARRITERDRLLMSLDATRRTDYLRAEMLNMTDRARLEYLHQLGAKRVLTPDEMRKLAK